MKTRDLQCAIAMARSLYTSFSLSASTKKLMTPSISMVQNMHYCEGHDKCMCANILSSKGLVGNLQLWQFSTIQYHTCDPDMLQWPLTTYLQCSSGQQGLDSTHSQYTQLSFPSLGPDLGHSCRMPLNHLLCQCSLSQIHSVGYQVHHSQLGESRIAWFCCHMTSSGLTQFTFCWMSHLKFI